MSRRNKRKKIILQQASFVSWLQSRHGAIVGYGMNAQACPISEWLADVRGVRCIVNNTNYVVADETISRPLPVWAQQFVSLVDQSCLDFPVYGDDALSLLQKVTA